MKEFFINHERIHFAQQVEKLLIGQWIFKFCEVLYCWLVKGKSGWDTYVLEASEQEAYDNMFDLSYLKNRKPFADLRKYLKHKPVDGIVRRDLENF